MQALKKISGKECAKILCNKFGFAPIRQTGSHLILKKQTPFGEIGTIIPMHKELKVGTLKGILELARINEDDFAKEQ